LAKGTCAGAVSPCTGSLPPDEATPLLLPPPQPTNAPAANASNMNKRSFFVIISMLQKEVSETEIDANRPNQIAFYTGALWLANLADDIRNLSYASP
jgi:hypothetical protein